MKKAVLANKYGISAVIGIILMVVITCIIAFFVFFVGDRCLSK